MNETELAAEVARLVLDASASDYLGDAVKIGIPTLGTIFVGIIGYLTAKKTADTNKSTQIEILREANANEREMAQRVNDLELKKAYEARRSLRYEQLIDLVQTFNASLTLHTTNVKNWIEDQENGKTISPEGIKKINDCETLLHDNFLNLLAAEAKLMVSGDIESQEKIRAYGVKAQSLFKVIHIENKTLSVDDIDAKMKEMRELRKELLISIGQQERLYNKADEKVEHPAGVQE